MRSGRPPSAGSRTPAARIDAFALSPAELIDAQLALEPAAAELAAFRRDPAIVGRGLRR